MHVIVNYDNFELGPTAEDIFFRLIRDSTEKHFLSATHYSTNAFFRDPELGDRFTDAQLGQNLDPTFAAARKEPGSDAEVVLVRPPGVDRAVNSRKACSTGTPVTQPAPRRRRAT